MITKWRLFNFKSIKNDTELALGPLTILAGSNSSGKSTVLQSMLLVSQTLQNRIGSRSVILNGPLAKLGQFSDLRSFNSDANQILIGWECMVGPGTQSKFSMIPALYSCSFSFEARETTTNRDLSQLQPDLFSCELTKVSSDERCSFVSSRRSSLSNLLKTSYVLNSSLTQDEVLRFLEYQADIEVQSSKPKYINWNKVEILGVRYKHFLPTYTVSKRLSTQIKSRKIISVIQYLKIIVDDLRTRVRNEFSNDEIYDYPIQLFKLIEERTLFIEKLIEQSPFLDRKSESPEDMLASALEEINIAADRILISGPHEGKDISGDIEKIKKVIRDIDKLMASGKQDQPISVVEMTPLPRQIEEIIDYFESYFTKNVKYLGPLRDEPKSIYPLSLSADPTDIGLRGEFIAAVYDLNKETQIKYIPSTNFHNSEVSSDTSIRSFDFAVQDWLEYLDVAESVKTIDRGKNGHEIKVTTHGATSPQDLTHVGVGVSQVLPILIMCFLAEPDTTLIIEQPELHLHPKVQTRLADFFLSMAMLGKQCIIETHSEYIINRLRFRAAAAKAEAISSLMKIYFVEKKEGNSDFRSVEVNKYGAITDWPDGFFDQSQSEAEEILRAATMKRKAEKGK